MSKTRKNRILLKKLKKTSKFVIPVVKTGLKTVGNTAKGVAIKSAPIIETGVSKIYGTMADGFNLGVKGAKGITNSVSKMRKRNRTKKGRK
jgi:hypothetical protein